MIKNAEVAMVHAANYALDYQDKKYNADVEEIIKQFLKDFNSLDIKPRLKLYSVAAISEIVKIKMSKENKGKSNKQLIQMFVNNIPEFSKGMQEEDSN